MTVPNHRTGILTKPTFTSSSAAARGAEVLSPTAPKGFAAAHYRRPVTTGFIAMACGVAPRTASIWFDKGLIKGYRIPGSLDRRVALGDLIEFMKAGGMDYVHLLEGYDCRMALVSNSARNTTEFELGALAHAGSLAKLVVGPRDGMSGARLLRDYVRALCPGCQIGVILPDEMAHLKTADDFDATFFDAASAGGWLGWEPPPAAPEPPESLRLSPAAARNGKSPA